MSRDILERAPATADARVRYGDHRSQVVDLYRPAGDGPVPVAVLLHGGYWRATYGLEHMSHLAAALRGRGIAAWNVEYRRLGEGGGWPSTFLDVAAAAEALVAAAGPRALDLGRIVAVGFSAGAQLALWLAAGGRLTAADAVEPAGVEEQASAMQTAAEALDRGAGGADPELVRQPGAAGPERPARPRLRGAVSLAGVVDLRRGSELGLSGGAVDLLLGGQAGRLPERLALASPYELLPLGQPQLLVHGQLDEHVPIELSRRYAERAAALGDPVELVELPETGHFELIDPRRPQGVEVVERVERMLGPS